MEDINKKIDKVYEEIGEFSSYQILLIILISSSAIVLSNADYSYNMYLGATPDYRCKIPILLNDTFEIANSEHEKIIEKYIPIKTDGTKYRENYDTCHLKNYTNDIDDSYNSSNSTYELVKCSEYVYSKLYYDKTTTSDWNLVCDDYSVKSLFTTLYFVGGLIGILPSGILSDKFGRKTIAYAFIIASSICYTLLSIILNIRMNVSVKLYLFGALRVLTGLVSTFYPIATVLVVELVGPSKRVLASNSIYYSFIIGQYFILLFGYLIRTYENLIIAYTILISVFIFYFWYIPESPRWLLLNNKTDKAIQIFEKIAKSNKRDTKYCLNLNNLQAKTSKDIKKDESKNLTVRQLVRYLIKSKKTLFTTLAIVFNWITNNLIYYGVGLNTSDLAGDPFANFAISISLELVAGLSGQFAFSKFGRKYPVMIAMFIAGVSLSITGFVPQDIPILVTVLALIAKFAISFPFNGMMIITSEYYPTVCRNTIISFCTTISQLGSIVAPQFYLMGELYFYQIPFIIFGLFAITSTILIFTLIPETKNRVLPDTFEDF